MTTLLKSSIDAGQMAFIQNIKSKTNKKDIARSLTINRYKYKQ
jgi:ribosomal protein L29